MTCGSTRASPPGWAPRPWTGCSPNGRCGPQFRQHGHQPRLQPGQPEELPSHRAGSRQPRRGQPAFRRHQLQQGRLRATDAGAFPDAQRVPHRPQRLSEPPFLPERPHHRPVDGPGRSLRPAGQHHNEQLDGPDRLSGARCGGQPRRWRPRAGSAARAVRL